MEFADEVRRQTLPDLSTPQMELEVPAETETRFAGEVEVTSTQASDAEVPSRVRTFPVLEMAHKLLSTPQDMYEAPPVMLGIAVQTALVL